MTGTSASVLAPAGAPAFAAAETAWLLIVGAAVVFAITMAALVWALRRRGGPANERLRVRGLVVGGGVVFPAVVLAALVVHQGWPEDAAPMRASDVSISVTGHSWWWQVRVRDPATGRAFSLANEIHLPAGRPAAIGINSADVIHSFWVPSLAGKVDAIPGRVQQLRVVPAEPGVHRAPCAEFCGDQHAKMTMVVVVEPPAAFERWLGAQAAPALPPSDVLAERGRAIFERERCAVCHAVRGLFEETSDLAPDLTHVGSRRFIGAGVLNADRDGFARWIAGVQHVKPGARMPQYDRLDAESLAALAAFMMSLR